MRVMLPAVIALLAAAPALAQPADAAAAALERARAAVAATCPAATARPAAPPTRVADSTVREASYHRILVEGCGQRMQRNYLAITTNDGARRMLEMLAGDSVADPVLQIDAMRAARMAAQAALPGCQQFQPRSAQFEPPDPEPAAARRTRPWNETWVIEGCGVRLAVPMLFTPTDRGTSFTARAGVRRLD